jgi:hypothetical protein
MRKVFIVFIALSLLFISTTVKAQYKSGFFDVYVSVTDVKHGLPFYMLAPIHPGCEVGATFLKKEKEKSVHYIDASLGYYYHDIIAHGSYLNVKYNYQIRIKEIIGIDLHSGLGFQYNIYPGEGYAFNESTNEYESVTNGKANLAINLGFGLSYTQMEKIHPFIHYDFNVHNVWAYATFVNSTAMLKAGIKYNF